MEAAPSFVKTKSGNSECSNTPDLTITKYNSMITINWPACPGGMSGYLNGPGHKHTYDIVITGAFQQEKQNVHPPFSPF